MKLPHFIKNNVVLKITSVNALVTGTRLVISFFVQQLLARLIGNQGYALVGDIRNLIPMLTSTSSLGVFSGVVKYVSEFQDNKPELVKVFSTATLFYVFGSLITSMLLLNCSEAISLYIFDDISYKNIIIFLAFMTPFIGLNRIVESIINGTSDYKNYAKVELYSYLVATVILVIALFKFELKGVLYAIALSPLIKLVILICVYGKTILKFLQPKKLQINFSYKNQLLAFTLMSFVSTFLINFIDIAIRGEISNQVSQAEAGNWTAVTFISKNYMVFASGLFSLYILPSFSKIKTNVAFKKELLYIYKTILPIFGAGMLLVFLIRHLIVDWVFTGFDGMIPLFKWQLLGDFVKLCFLVLNYQLLAKKMVKSYVFLEFASLVLFYVIALLLIKEFKTEGIVMAHFFRSIGVLLMSLIIFRKALFFSK